MTSRARRPEAERAAVQGHLRRAPRDRVPGRRRGAGVVRARARGAPRAGATSASRRTTSGCSTRRGGSSRSAASAATTTSSRCCSACGPSSATGWSRRAIGSASTSRSGASGTRTRCGGSRRTRRSPATSRPTRSAVSSGAATGVVIWARAEGCRVWDADGREYLDLSGGFGVAALGHRNPRDPRAVANAPVVHALGDLAEAEVTAELRGALPVAGEARRHRGGRGRDRAAHALLATGSRGSSRSTARTTDRAAGARGDGVRALP